MGNRGGLTIKLYTQLTSCGSEGVGAPNLHTVQGSTVYEERMAEISPNLAKYTNHRFKKLSEPKQDRNPKEHMREHIINFRKLKTKS